MKVMCSCGCGRRVENGRKSSRCCSACRSIEGEVGDRKHTQLCDRLTRAFQQGQQSVVAYLEELGVEEEEEDTTLILGSTMSRRDLAN
jgi:hypothetical protein